MKIVRKSSKLSKLTMAMFSLKEPQAKQVFIAGEFTKWNPHPMKEVEKGVWKIQLSLRPGKYEYKFIVDGQWITDPNCHSFNQNPYGTQNCLMIIN